MNSSSVKGILAAAFAGVVLGASTGLAAPAAAAGGVQDAGLSLAGTWVLNEDQSDGVEGRRGERGRDGERRGRGRDGVRGGGRGPGGLGGRGRPNPEQIARLREAVRELVRAGRRITIAGDAGEVVLTYGDGRVVRLLPDGRRHAGVAGSGAQVTRTAKWTGETLETAVELPLPTPVPRSVTVRQTYAVQNGADGGRQLVVTSRIEGRAPRLRAGDREVRRVYDAAEQ